VQTANWANVTGQCPPEGLLGKGEIENQVSKCNSDSSFCDSLGDDCKDAWDSGGATIAQDCLRKNCDKTCDEKHFNWCPGLSTQTIIIIVAVCIVVVIICSAAIGLYCFCRQRRRNYSDVP
jgi:hypothetical protein